MSQHQYESVILVENEDLVVTRERLPVGGFAELHTHTSPFLLIAISGDRGEVRDADGKLLYDIDYKAFTPGFMGYVGPEQLPDTHSLRNTGAEPIVVLQVDLHALARRDESSLA